MTKYSKKKTPSGSTGPKTSSMSDASHASSLVSGREGVGDCASPRHWPDGGLNVSGDALSAAIGLAVSGVTRPLTQPPGTDSNAAVSRLELILSELEGGCSGEVGKEGRSDPVGYLRKKIAALGFQAGIQLSSAGVMRDARNVLAGFPGDEDYELAFDDSEETSEGGHEDENGRFDAGDTSDDDSRDELTDSLLLTAESLSDDFLLGLDPMRALAGQPMRALAGQPMRTLAGQPVGQSVGQPSRQLAGHLSGQRDAKGARPTSPTYPLVDPLKLQVIQSAESELTTVHDLFESSKMSPGQKLPLLKRKYMELMQQDIRHRLETLRIRDYLDTLHLERQVVELELEKMTQLKTTLEQLCDQLQTENVQIKAEKAGLGRIYAELELTALNDFEDDGVGAGTSASDKRHGGKQKRREKEQEGVAAAAAAGRSIKGNSGGTRGGPLPRLGAAGFPTTLPEPIKSLSYEVPDAGRMLDKATDAVILTNRLALLVEMYNRREGHFLAVLRAKDAEIALLQSHYFAHMTQLQKQTGANRELSLRLTTLSASEADLRAQLAIYVDKFKQVEDTLAKSNDLFATFRHEMEQMTRKLGRMERENQTLQDKCTTLSRNIIEMAEERTKQNDMLKMALTQKKNLERLCRIMQAERNAVPGQCELLGDAQS